MPKFKQMKLPAIEGMPNTDRERLKFYTVEAPAEIVATFAAERALDVEGGFQRPLDIARTRKIGSLMSGDRKKNREPSPHTHGGLLAYALNDEVSYAPSTGTLTIRKPLHLLDGQTRAGGAAWSVENGLVTDYTETVRIVVGATREELVRWYLTANMTARKAPPQNVLLNIATFTGTQNNRKSWIARQMINLATEAPFTLQHGSDIHRIVSFATRDGGQLSAYSLYKAVNFMLPDELNKEGNEVERKAHRYARDAFKLYASMYEDWGKTDDDGKLVHHDCYEFTMISAFARFYKAVRLTASSESVKDSEINDIVRKAWISVGFDKGLPEDSGSGERAALALANYAASEARIGNARVKLVS